MAKIVDLNGDSGRLFSIHKGSVRFNNYTMNWVPFYTDKTGEVNY